MAKKKPSSKARHAKMVQLVKKKTGLPHKSAKAIVDAAHHDAMRRKHARLIQTLSHAIVPPPRPPMPMGGMPPPGMPPPGAMPPPGMPRPGPPMRPPGM